MKELLIKIRALFEGNGADQAASSLNKVSDAAEKAKGSTSGLSGGLGDGAAKAGIFGGAMAAVTGAVIGFAEQALSAAINAIKNLVAGFIEGIAKAAEFAGAMTDLSARTGQPIEQLVVLRRAFENAGMGADAVGPMLNRLQKALAGVNEDGAPTSEILNKLGLSVSQLNQMTATQQLEAIARAISSLPTPAQQAAAAMELFGKSGGQMLALLKDGQAFSTAAQQVGSLGANTAKAAASLDTFSDAMAGLDDKKMGFFVAAAAQFSTELEKAGIALNKLDLGPLGEQVGFVVRGAIEVTKEVNAWVTWVKQFTDAIGATGPIVDSLSLIIKKCFDPFNISGFLGYLRDTGQAAVGVEKAQQAVDEQIKSSAASAEALKARMRENEQVARGAIASVSQAGNSEALGTANAAQGKINDSGRSAQEGIRNTSQQGAQQIRLTAQQIEEAARTLASAFQTGMGQDISPALQSLINAVRSNFANLGVAINATSQQLSASLSPATITQPLQALNTTVTTFSTTMTTQLQQLGTAMASLAATAQQMATVTASLQQQMGLLQTGVNALATSVQSANIPALGQSIAQVGTTLQQGFQSIANAVGSMAGQVGSAVSAAVNAVWAAIGRLQAQINALAARR